MILESLDGLLHQVLSIIVWGNKLKHHIVQVDDVLEVLGAFIV